MIERAIQSQRGEVAYEPDIDWGRHTLRAKFDTLVVQLHFAETIHPNTAYARVNKATGRDRKGGQGVRIVGLKPANEFVLRLQDPTPANTVALARLEGLVGATVTEIHMALDFRGVDGDVERAQVVAALALLYSAPGVDLSGAGEPRRVRGGLTTPLDLQTLRARPMQTFYFGQRNMELMARIYDKRFDGGRQLPPDQWVCRHEVEVRGDALRSLGVSCIHDLVEFDFRRMTPLFKYATVVWHHADQTRGTRNHMRYWLRRQRTAGYGVARLSASLDRPRRVRVSSGGRTTQRTIGRRCTVAHERLNDRARKAWKQFATRWTKVCNDFGRTQPPKAIFHAICAPAPITSKTSNTL